MSADRRQPMTPAEFDAACRTLARRANLSETSGRRTPDRNAKVGGKSDSKHLLGMARDFVGTDDALKRGVGQAQILGLWWLIHGEGSNKHLHIQGLPPGDVPAWWLAKYAERDD